MEAGVRLRCCDECRDPDRIRVLRWAALVGTVSRRAIPIEEQIEQWFCNAPVEQVQTMLLGLRLICRARGGVVWPEATSRPKRKRRAVQTQQTLLQEQTV